MINASIKKTEVKEELLIGRRNDELELSKILTNILFTLNQLQKTIETNFSK